MDSSGTERAPLVPGYDVLEPLGHGASATVWRARRRADGLVVALKVLERADGDVAAGLREAGLLAGVRHQHVVRLYDVLPLPDPQTGRPAAVALATQLAGGGSLAQVLSRRRRLSAGELVTALQPVAGALVDLHGRGMVHGDLSTGNVLFTGDGMPLLSDLGAARVAGSAHAGPLGTGADQGLVAPEVVEGFPATQESDVYQLGAVCWLALAGEPPGPGWARGDLVELAPALPAGLADLVTRCLAPEPGDRPDAEEVALALLATAAPEPVEVAPDADPGHGLTERLRQQARDDLAERADAEPTRRRGLRLPRRRREPVDVRPSAGGRSGRREPHERRSVPGRPAEPARRARGQHRQAVPDGTRAGGTGPGVRAAAWAGLAVLVLVGVVGAARLVGVDLRSALAGGPPAATVTVEEGAAADGPVEPVEAAVAEATSEPVEEAALPGAGTDPAGDEVLLSTVQALVDARALAWEEGDPDLLASVTAQGSPALAAEADALEEARAQGVRYAEVSFRVERAVLVEEAGDRLTVDAAVARAPLTGTDTSGQTVVEEPGSTERVRLVLARDEAGWLLWSWAPQDESSTR
ncbi:serine/threonine-protein kinase [Ornithinimicrobium avium]|uniref:serine/threonine-protein kinase n=1 Tax=Ornithinimicrobium avium TaxID=2283195 RepID=UPI0013B3BFA9|nr:serine/threonine-protein kinase [Ornithinimicrobium avium]